MNYLKILALANRLNETVKELKGRRIHPLMMDHYAAATG
jgi:hypothetical protein